MEELVSSTHARAANVARASYGRLLALLVANTRDISAAEDALADAFEEALIRWPVVGIPENPEAWLLTVARNRQTDRFRSAAYRTSTPLEGALDRADSIEEIDVDVIGDKRLALMFLCAHPAIDVNIRTPLMLQTVLGFRAEEIARAFAIPTPTMAQRLVRAKHRIRDIGLPFAVPERSEMASRLPDVLEAVYGTYAIDWHGVAGSTQRDSLSWEALYLAETLADLLSSEPETLGLAALICFSLARAPGRLDADGFLIPLLLQDTSRWDETLIARGESYLLRAHHYGKIGRFQLEAAIQSVHCARRTTDMTDWKTLRKLHEALIDCAPTLGAVVSLAVVVTEIEGPTAGLAILDAMDSSHAQRFQPAWATRAHFLTKVGRATEAVMAFNKAISLTTDPVARTYLRRKVSELNEHDGR